MNDTARTLLPAPLISVADLDVALADPGPPVLLDVQFTLGDPDAGLVAYGERHLAGARHCDLDTVLAGPVGASGGRHPLPAADDLQADLRELGLSIHSSVVVYDAGDGMASARAWWVLRWAGVVDVRILDGGLPAWIAAGLPVDSGTPDPAPPGDLVVRPGSMPTLDAEQAAMLATDGVLLDARAAARYRGEVEPIDPVAGHIPGATSAPTADNLDVDGRYRSSEDLTSRFAELGIDGDASVGTYCGSGVSAAQQVVALQIAGIPAALYVGSWSDWVSDPTRPVATGSEERTSNG